MPPRLAAKTKNTSFKSDINTMTNAAVKTIFLKYIFDEGSEIFLNVTGPFMTTSVYLQTFLVTLSH
jgi:hypothetical protein